MFKTSLGFCVKKWVNWIAAEFHFKCKSFRLIISPMRKSPKWKTFTLLMGNDYIKCYRSNVNLKTENWINVLAAFQIFCIQGRNHFQQFLIFLIRTHRAVRSGKSESNRFCLFFWNAELLAKITVFLWNTLK